jgi:hypothetical protein
VTFSRNLFEEHFKFHPIDTYFATTTINIQYRTGRKGGKLGQRLVRLDFSVFVSSFVACYQPISQNFNNQISVIHQLLDTTMEENPHIELLSKADPKALYETTFDRSKFKQYRDKINNSATPKPLEYYQGILEKCATEIREKQGEQVAKDYLAHFANLESVYQTFLDTKSRLLQHVDNKEAELDTFIDDLVQKDTQDIDRLINAHKESDQLKKQLKIKVDKLETELQEKKLRNHQAKLTLEKERRKVLVEEEKYTAEMQTNQILQKQLRELKSGRQSTTHPDPTRISLDLNATKRQTMNPSYGSYRTYGSMSGLDNLKWQDALPNKYDASHHNDASSFVDAMEDYFELQNIVMDQEKYFRFRMNCEGKGRQWMSDKDMTNWSWDQVKLAFINFYSGVKTQEEKFEIVEDYKYDETIPIDEWFHKLLTLFKGSGICRPGVNARESAEFQYRVTKNLPKEYKRETGGILSAKDTDSILERARMIYKMRQEEGRIGRLSERINRISLRDQLMGKIPPARKGLTSVSYAVTPAPEESQDIDKSSEEGVEVTAYAAHANPPGDRSRKDQQSYGKKYDRSRSMSRGRDRYQSRSRSRGRSNSRGRYNHKDKRSYSKEKRTYKCFKCFSPDHMIRECPIFIAELQEEIRQEMTKEKSKDF